MAENIVLESGATIDNQALREILGRTGISGYVEWGMGFDPNWSDGVLNVGAGMAFLLDAHRDYPLRADATIDVSFSSGTVSDVYAIYNADAADGEQADVVAVAGSESAPTYPSLLIGQVDDTNQTVTELNRSTPAASPLEDGDNDGYLEIPNHEGIENDYDALVNAPTPHQRPEAGNALTDDNNTFNVNESAIDIPEQHTRPSAGDGLSESNNTFNVDESEIDIPEQHTRPSAGDGLSESNNTFNVDESEIDFPSGSSVVNARNFSGANGGEQIQNAINSIEATGGEVVVPQNGPDGGEWHVHDTIIVGGDNIQIRGVGATLINKPDGSSDSIIDTNDYDNTFDGEYGTRRDNIHVLGLRFDGNRSGQTYYPCIGLVNATDSSVRNCFFRNAGYAVNVKSSRGCVVDNCRAVNMHDDGYTISQTNITDPGAVETYGNIIRDSVAVNNNDSGFEFDDGGNNIFIRGCYAANNEWGFSIHSHGGTQGASDPTHVHITDCAAVDNSQCGYRLGRFANGAGRYYRLAGITALNNGVSGISCSEVGDNTNDNNVRNIYISDFYIYHPSSATESAIYLTPTGPVAATSVGIQNGMINCSGATYGIGVRERGIRYLHVSGVEVQDAESGIGIIRPTDVDQIVLSGNIIRDCDGPGIRLSSEVGFSNAAISNNMLVNNGAEADGAAGEGDDSGVAFMSVGGAPFSGHSVVGNVVSGSYFGFRVQDGFDEGAVGLNNCVGTTIGVTGTGTDRADNWGAGSQVGLNIFP